VDAFNRPIWVYEITDAPQFCPFPSFVPVINGVQVELSPPSPSRRAALIYIRGSNQTYVSRGEQNFTSIGEMRCVDETASGIGIVPSGTPAKNGEYIEATVGVSCDSFALGQNGELVSRNIELSGPGDPVINGGGTKLFYMLEVCDWSCVRIGEGLKCYGGFYPEGIVGPGFPPFRNVRRLSSTIDEPYEWPNDHIVRLSSVLSIKSLSVTL
jgi:hypothetical protein